LSSPAAGSIGELAGTLPTYEEYLGWSNQVRQTLNRDQFYDADWEPRPRPAGKSRSG
jgi:hypothetical protein